MSSLGPMTTAKLEPLANSLLFMLDSPHCPKDTINLKDFLVGILAAVHTSLLESCFSFLFIIESPHCLKDTINLKDFLVGILAAVHTSLLESCSGK